jgi:hypothetical protein
MEALIAEFSSVNQAEFWAERIRTSLSRSIESIIQAGRDLIEAKAKLEHGEWERMFDDELLPFGARTARRLMAIANHPILSNRTHASDLPSSWMTLYELSRVPEPKLEEALSSGTITPEMPRKAVAALIDRAEQEAAGPFDPTIDDLTILLRRFFERMLSKWPEANRELFAVQLRGLADEVESMNGND